MNYVNFEFQDITDFRFFFICQHQNVVLFTFLYTFLSILLQKATAIPSKKAEYFDASEPVQNRVYKSLKVWSMLADLEESLGTFQVSSLQVLLFATMSRYAVALNNMVKKSVSLPCALTNL